MSNVLEVVEADHNLATMSKGVKAAGLEIELSKEGPFTVFAPTDTAFNRLSAGELAELLKPEYKAKLSGILQNHVVQGKRELKDLKDGDHMKSLGGKKLTVKIVDGEVTVNGSKIKGKDHQASNGIVHSMDQVIK
jgi:uncharacterized surface protein with fasciclin (FAS1) repeats